MTPVIQAIIPQLGENLKSSHLYSFAEAFNTRILNGAGDSHWRIPYYIFSAYFRKPRLDDNMLYTPESEFFDFYQFVNPSTGETWPTNPPQEPEGANLQTNFLNRFIFGMNYQTKDKDGAWLYEREDVRIQKGQEKIKFDSASFRGFVFPFFTAIGTDTGIDREYTSFGISSEIYSNGYMNGNSVNPQGNSFGGYYGKNPLIISANGCGSDSVTKYEFPLSVSSIIKIDGAKDDKKSFLLYNVCNESIGDVNRPDEYSIINSGNPNSILAFTLKNKIPTDINLFPKNKYHLSQFQSTVFFGREQKNHIHRLLYNYITYAKGFDFDWFFNNQYSYAPEIGSFMKMVSIYDQNPDQYYGRLNLLSTDIQVSQARLTLQKTGLSASRINNGTFAQNGTTAITITFTSNHSYLVGNYIFISFYAPSGILLEKPIEAYYFITGITSNTITIQSSTSDTINGIVDIRNFLPIIDGYLSKSIADGAFIQTKYYGQDGKTLNIKETISGPNSVANYLLNNDFLAKGWESLLSSPYLYSYDNNNPDKVVIPLGFALNNIEIISSTLKKFTLTVHYYVNEIYVSYRDIKIDYTIVTPGNKISKPISNDIFLATITTDIVYSVKFEIRDIEILSPNTTALVNLQPIFLFAYKPRIEDAYALLRACTYYGIKDANFDDENHPLNRAYYFSNRLKESGVLGSGDVPLATETHNPQSVELNNNGVYEASRRLSLYTRIIKPDNFLGIKNGTNNTLIFKRYAMQSANTKGPRSSLISYGPRSSLTVPFNIFATDDDIYKCIPYKDNYGMWANPLFGESAPYSSPYYSGFKKYNFIFQNESNKIIQNLNNNLVASLATVVNETTYPTRVNKNNTEFTPTSYSFNYDSLVEGANAKYLYYQFEDEYGVKFNNGSEDAPSYYAKRYTSENGNTSTNVYLNEAGSIVLDETDLIFLGQTSSKKASFNIYVFIRTPNEDSLRILNDSGRQFYHVDKNGSFIRKLNSDAWKSNYSGYKAANMKAQGPVTINTLPDEPIYYYLTSPNRTSIINLESINNTDTIASYDLTLDVELKNLANILYENYRKSDVQLNMADGSISYVNNSAFNEFTSFSIDDYNKYLAGYKIVVSYFKNHSENTQIFDNSSPLTATIVKFTVYNFDQTVSKTFSYSIDSLIELPRLTGNETYFKLEITVNNYKSKISKESVQLNVYLGIINAILSEDDPILEPINRDGSVFISRSAKLINADNALPTARDMFQGIAPSSNNILSGSLLINQEYSVSGGVIVHEGQSYGVGYSSKFIAKSTQYTISSLTDPLIIQSNGIIELAPPSSFTNEWAFWMNFLPYSGSPTSSFKEEVYGATNSPFIDRCHINSKLIARSEENKYFNLGLPKTYIPEMAPSYRYVPLLTKQGLVYENIAGQSNIQKSFYNGCKAFRPPYKIKKAYISDEDNYQNVYIELDRVIDGFSLDRSSNPQETFRTDYNGLTDWINRGSGFGIKSFRIGDASLTNDSGNNQATNNTANGYQGSYYPRFFFVKLIPKPYADKNMTGEDSDSPTNHDMIKQAELYLEAMREGFTANSGASRGRLACQNIKGHLTPPDYKYDQLLINSTDNSDYFGNKWPSLLTSSINFNLAPLRSEDNPRGFGAIPNVGTYLEPYMAIAKSINSLVNFRIPFPLNVYAEVSTYSKSESVGVVDENPPIRYFGGGNGPIWFRDLSPSSVADIASPIYGSTTIYNLRNSDGALTGAGAGQSYSIVDSDIIDFNINITKASVGKSYTSSKINVKGIDSSLSSIAYYDIYSILPSVYSLPAFVTKQKTITKLSPARLPSSSNCSEYYRVGEGSSAQYYKIENVITDSTESCENITSVTVFPESMPQGKPFYRRVNPYECDGPGSNFNIISFGASSSTNYSIFDTGFQIGTLITKTLNNEDVT